MTVQVDDGTIWHLQRTGKGKDGVAYCGIGTYGVPHIGNFKRWALEMYQGYAYMEVCDECLQQLETEVSPQLKEEK